MQVNSFLKGCNWFFAVCNIEAGKAFILTMTVYFTKRQPCSAVAKIDDRTASQQTGEGAVPVFKILGYKRTRVMTLTFLGHVTS